MINFFKQWYEIWEYNWLQDYVSKWNPMGIVYAYREVKEEVSNDKTKER